MKKAFVLYFLSAAAFLFAQNEGAEPEAARAGLKSMSLSGATGLYTVPSGTIGWEENHKLGVDLGGSYNFFSKNGMAKAGISLFNWAEITGAVDFQPFTHDKSNIDGILGAKLRFPTKKTAISLGGNAQFLSYENEFSAAGQLYLAASYTGEFFTWPAETSFAIGYTFREENRDDIDFGMGFDLVLFPGFLGKMVHWIVDFSNFSYSCQALGADAWHRGCLNTGIRLDFGAALPRQMFKIVFDAAFLDIFDHERSVALSLTLGMPLK